MPQGRARIYLGQVEKMDTVYVNGRQVGSSSWVENPRVYSRAMGLKPGQNVITIRLFRVQAAGGGFLDGADSMKLVLGDGTAIPLGGEWKGKVCRRCPAAASAPSRLRKPAHHASRVLYNGMLAPVAPLAITGAIWYQGESNADRAHQYRNLLPAMIADWRQLFGQGDFPFYIVGLPASSTQDAPVRRLLGGDPRGPGHRRETVPEFLPRGHHRHRRPGQHPPGGQESVGERLAICALASTTASKIPYGPTSRFRRAHARRRETSLRSHRRRPGGEG